MGDNFLYRALTVCIDPAIVLLNSMAEMIKFTTSAVLITEHGKIQILASIPNRNAYAMLEMESRFSVDLFTHDRYALLLHLNTWIERLQNPVLQEPLSLLFIDKSPGSPLVKCILGDNQQLIEVGDADFVQAKGLYTDNFPCRVKVTMRSDHFREFTDPSVSRDHNVQLVITNYAICWVKVQSRLIIHCTRNCTIEGVRAGIVYRFRLWWNWPLFQMLDSVSNSYQSVEVSAVNEPPPREREWYRFRFFSHGQSYSFCYIQRPTR